jgi:hypothetical protein
MAANGRAATTADLYGANSTRFGLTQDGPQFGPPGYEVAFGTGIGNAGSGQPATEDRFGPDHPNPRAASEIAAEAVAARGVSVSVVRLPQGAVSRCRRGGRAGPRDRRADRAGFEDYRLGRPIHVSDK